MSPEIGQAATRIALFLITASLLALIWVDKGSAEFVVLVLTIIMGLALLGVVALLVRMGASRFPAPPPPQDDRGEERPHIKQ